jgi:hypothetical protein
MHTLQNTVVLGLVIIFLIIGILNLILVHPVPGVFYILLSLIYLPATDTYLKKKINLSIPPLPKIIIALVILWGTLAVGDLAEILGL